MLPMPTPRARCGKGEAITLRDNGHIFIFEVDEDNLQILISTLVNILCQGGQVYRCVPGPPKSHA